MNVEHLVAQLARIEDIVRGWSRRGADSLERDLVLEELRRIYETIRFAAPADGAVSEESPVRSEEAGAGDGAPSPAESPAARAGEPGGMSPADPGADMPCGANPEAPEAPATEEETGEGRDVESDSSLEEEASARPAETVEAVPVSAHPAETLEAAPVSAHSAETVEAVSASAHPAHSAETLETAPVSARPACSADGPARPETEPEAISISPAAESSAAPSEAAPRAVPEPASAQGGERRPGAFGDGQRLRARLRSLYDDEEYVPEQAACPVREPVSPSFVAGASEASGAAPVAAEAGSETPPGPEETPAPTGASEPQMPAESAVPEADAPAAPAAWSVPGGGEVPLPDKPTPVLGEVIGSGGPVLGEVVGVARRTDASCVDGGRIVSLRGAIGINDKFLLIRDLFGGDAVAYERTIARLDEFGSLDEAIVWLHDHYRWNPSSEGARLLADLLARKLM